MKLKIIAAALAGISTTTAFAGSINTTFNKTPSPCEDAYWQGKTTSQVVNGVTLASVVDAKKDENIARVCPPNYIFYITGASAPTNTVKQVVPKLFNGTPVTITAPGTATNKSITGWYGTANVPGIAGSRLYVAYNSRDGSAAGVRQLISKTSTEDLAQIVVPGGEGCSLAASQTAGFTTVVCSKEFPVEADMAFSDVLPWELDHAYLKANNLNKMPDVSSGKLLTTTPVALQGFTVAVNMNLYELLAKRDVARGVLPAECGSMVGSTVASVALSGGWSGTATVSTGMAIGANDNVANRCRPSISRAEYASLAGEGGVTSAAQWLGIPEASLAVTLNRRVASSGTQAASNMYFLNSQCSGYGKDITGVVTNVAGKNVNASLLGAPIKSTFGGAISPRSGVTDLPGTLFGTGVYVREHSETADVRTAIRNNTTGYAIGVVSLDGGESGALVAEGRYIKVDGAHPMLKNDGSYDVSQRHALARGSYPFAFELQAVRKFTKKPTVLDNIAEKVISDVRGGDNALTGVAYFPGYNNEKLGKLGTDGVTWTGGETAALSDRSRVALVKRAGGNNCAPLVRTVVDSNGQPSN